MPENMVPISPAFQMEILNVLFIFVNYCFKYNPDGTNEYIRE